MSSLDSASAEAARDALELLLHEQRDARQLRAMAAATSELEAAKEVAIERESGARNSSNVPKLARATTTKGAQMFADYEAKTLKRVRELKRSKYLIDPRTSKLMPNWDVVTSIALIFTAIMTPVEVGFMDIPADRWADGLFITNRCVDIIFIIDLLMQFFIMCARLRARDESRALPAALCRSTDCLPYPSRAPRTGTRCPTIRAIRAKSGSRLGARSRGTT